MRPTLLSLALLAALACNTTAHPLPPPSAHATHTASGLVYDDLALGTGAEARAGQRVSVHYTGWLQLGGAEFDSSRPRGEPLAFTLGAGEVIPGWDEGIAGMKVGGQRRLFIPSELAYGTRGFGNTIPRNAALVFDVELVAVGD